MSGWLRSMGRACRWDMQKGQDLVGGKQLSSARLKIVQDGASLIRIERLNRVGDQHDVEAATQ